MTYRQHMIPVLLCFLLGSCCGRNFDREIELLEQERIQLMKEELTSRIVLPKDIHPARPYSLPMDDESRLMPAPRQARGLNIDRDSLLWE